MNFNVFILIKNIIEMFLDKIPGLSERFIYINNNYYFINYTIHDSFLIKIFFLNIILKKYFLTTKKMK